jgi:UTP-glucose-1-phosphate uridylyltransferase
VRQKSVIDVLLFVCNRNQSSITDLQFHTSFEFDYGLSEAELAEARRELQKVKAESGASGQ